MEIITYIAEKTVFFTGICRDQTIIKLFNPADIYLHPILGRGGMKIVLNWP